MNRTEVPTDDELYKITIIGLSRSIEMLEEYVLNCVDPKILTTKQERNFLNRVKERTNTRAHPISVYLRPNEEP